MRGPQRDVAAADPRPNNLPAASSVEVLAFMNANLSSPMFLYAYDACSRVSCLSSAPGSTRVDSAPTMATLVPNASVTITTSTRSICSAQPVLVRLMKKNCVAKTKQESGPMCVLPASTPAVQASNSNLPAPMIVFTLSRLEFPSPSDNANGRSAGRSPAPPAEAESRILIQDQYLAVYH